MPSMRRRLWWMLLLTLGLILLANGLFGGLIVRHEVDKVFDAQLVNTSRMVRRLVEHTNGPTGTSRPLSSFQLALSPLYQPLEAVPDDIRVYEKNLLIQLWSSDGSAMLFRSPQCPYFAIAPLQPGFHDVVSGDHQWRVFVIELPLQQSWLLVGEVPEARHSIHMTMLNIFTVSGLLVMVMGAFVVSSVIERGFKPLWYLRQSLARRTVNHLGPVQLNPTPRELRPVIDGLNQMLKRLDEGMTRERRFVADAAHELRTPLAVIRLAGQTAERQIQDDGHANLQPLFNATDRANRVVEQLLLLARLEQGQAYPEPPSQVDMAECIRRIVADLYSRTSLDAERYPDVELVIHHETEGRQDDRLPMVRCHTTLVEIALNNVLDNGLKYGSARLLVEAGTESLHHRPYVWIRVRDFGPGVPDHALPNLTNAFFRNGQSDVAGAGLGLSIVCKTLQVMQGELGLRNHPDGGLEAVIRLPLS